MKRKLLLILLCVLMVTCCAIGFAACNGDDEKDGHASVDTVSQLAEQYGAQTKNFFVNEVIEKALPSETDFDVANILGATVDLGDPQATELQSVKVVLLYASNAVDRVYRVSEISFAEPVALSAVAGYDSENASSVNAAATELYNDNANILAYAYSSPALTEAIFEKVVQSDETPLQLTLKLKGGVFDNFEGGIVSYPCNKYELIAQTEHSVTKYIIHIKEQDSEEEIIESLNNEKNYGIRETEEITTLQTPLIVSDYMQEDESDIPAAENFMTFESYGNGYAVTGLDERYRGTAIEIPASHNGMPVSSIGGYAFAGFTSITSVTIPDSVTSIAVTAFSGCDSLAEVHIADIAVWCGIEFTDTPLDGVKLYLNDELVTDLVIPDGVTSIGDYAFAGFTSITSVTISDSVTSIGSETFSGCPIERATIPTFAIAYIPQENLKTVVITSGEIIGYSAFNNCSSLTSVTIPDSVTSIGSNAFKGCSSLTSVTVPDSVQEIGKDAFSGCPIETATVPSLAIDYIPQENLKTVVITSGESIGYNAFYNCSSLTSVTIPDSVTSIGSNAFKGCSSLTGVTIPDSVTRIGISAFEGCSSLESMTLPFVGANKNATSDTHFGYIFGADSYSDNGNYVPQTLKEVVVTGADSIGEYAFSTCSSLTSVTIPDSVTSIGISAFAGCSSLESMTLPFVGANKNGTSNTHFGYIFGADSYSDNGNYVPQTLKEVVVTGGDSIGDSAFLYCYYLTSIVIPDSVTSIGEDAFAYSNRLSGIVIPDSVKSIGKSAFSGCSSLTSITIPDSVTSIGDWAFSDCSSLSAIEVDQNNGNYCSENGVLLNRSKTELLCYPAGKTETYYTVPNSVTSIGISAFGYCTSLTGIALPDGMTSIGDSAFWGCSSLTSITIPDGVESIGGYAFYNCSSLTSIEFPDSVTAIGEYAFDDCSALEQIVLPEELKRIEVRAFSFCTSLTSITIPDSVTSIGEYAFAWNNSLIKVTIGKNVKDIATGAFEGCIKLVEVQNLSSLYLTAGGGAHGSIGRYALHVYTANGQSRLTTDDNGLIFYEYKSTVYLLGYSGKAAELTLPEQFNGKNYVIYDYAFWGRTVLTSITIPVGVTSIGEYAFSNCSSLTDIIFNGTMEQWKKIPKGNSWNSDTGNYTVHCTDGDIAKN